MYDVTPGIYTLILICDWLCSILHLLSYLARKGVPGKVCQGLQVGP